MRRYKKMWKYTRHVKQTTTKKKPNVRFKIIIVQKNEKINVHFFDIEFKREIINLIKNIYLIINKYYK